MVLAGRGLAAAIAACLGCPAQRLLASLLARVGSSWRPASSTPAPQHEGRRLRRPAAGRYDLHHAIMYGGGYGEVAQRLGWTPASGRHTRLAEPGALRAALLAFCRGQGLPQVGRAAGPPRCGPPRCPCCPPARLRGACLWC
jgi:hypothetical protein